MSNLNSINKALILSLKENKFDSLENFINEVDIKDFNSEIENLFSEYIFRKTNITEPTLIEIVDFKNELLELLESKLSEVIEELKREITIGKTKVERNSIVKKRLLRKTLIKKKNVVLSKKLEIDSILKNKKVFKKKQLAGKPLNIADRYAILLKIYDKEDKKIHQLGVNTENSDLLLSLILDCDITTARHLRTGKSRTKPNNKIQKEVDKLLNRIIV